MEPTETLPVIPSTVTNKRPMPDVEGTFKADELKEFTLEYRKFDADNKTHNNKENETSHLVDGDVTGKPSKLIFFCFMVTMHVSYRNSAYHGNFMPFTP